MAGVALGSVSVQGGAGQSRAVDGAGIDRSYAHVTTTLPSSHPDSDTIVTGADHIHKSSVSY